MISKKQIKNAHNDVENIFRNILPEYGMTEREGQINLCHTMLDTMLESKIALSDAGTGIGKTYSYIVAGVVYDKYRRLNGEAPQAVIISTASIALQNAVQNDYIPFLSKALMEAGYIDEPITSVIRKGKSHYVCDERLKERLRKANLNKKNHRNAEALLSLKKKMDMDDVPHLSSFDRAMVTVPKICDCSSAGCRYSRYIKRCNFGNYLFQICNHNLLFADAIHACYKMSPILPEHCAIIIDEAHKLSGAARQMLGKTLGYDDILSLVNGLRGEHFPLAAQNLISAMKPVAKGMSAQSDEDILEFQEERNTLLKSALITLESIKRAIGNEVAAPIRQELMRMIRTISLFTDEESDIIIYTDTDERQRPTLCASSADLSDMMEKLLWSKEVPIILTSGTLAVGEDFSRFKSEVCLKDSNRRTESVSLSPFDYENNCLLYVPYDAVRYDEEQLADYYKHLSKSISELIRAGNGHSLVLFNSYSAMSAVREQLKELPYPIFAMSRNSPNVVNEFKQSKNGVLLATGSAWEGVDFPGDMVSMLIIPRLPFAIPDAFGEYQKEQYSSLREFIKSVAVPDMQIKLRQGFGRAMRLETDSCVVAILDERSIRGHRYFAAVKAALPDMPICGSLSRIERFLRSVKADSYFTEVE